MNCQQSYIVYICHQFNHWGHCFFFYSTKGVLLNNVEADDVEHYISRAS